MDIRRLLKAAPVSSRNSTRSYKLWFCFLCYNITQLPFNLYWPIPKYRRRFCYRLPLATLLLIINCVDGGFDSNGWMDWKMSRSELTFNLFAGRNRQHFVSSVHLIWFHERQRRRWAGSGYRNRRQIIRKQDTEHLKMWLHIIFISTRCVLMFQMQFNAFTPGIMNINLYVVLVG